MSRTITSDKDLVALFGEQTLFNDKIFMQIPIPFLRNCKISNYGDIETTRTDIQVRDVNNEMVLLIDNYKISLAFLVVKTFVSPEYLISGVTFKDRDYKNLHVSNLNFW